MTAESAEALAQKLIRIAFELGEINILVRDNLLSDAEIAQVRELPPETLDLLTGTEVQSVSVALREFAMRLDRAAMVKAMNDFQS